MTTPAHQQNITVSESAPGHFVIDSVPDIPMQKQPSGAIIQWEIVTPNWNFAATDGIHFKTNANQMQNSPGQIGGHPNRWQATDLNSPLAESKVTYGINAVGPNGATASLDPTIINGQGHI